MPPLKHRRAICELETAELYDYKEKAKVPMGKLIRVDKETGKMTWN